MFSLKKSAKVGVLLFLTSILVCSVAGSEAERKQPTSAERMGKTAKITGTYTSLHFNSEGGDLLGQELKIVLTQKGYQGVLQLAEGGAGELIVVDVQINADKLTFTIPDTYGDAGRFEGTIQNGAIRGIFTFKGGGTNNFDLKKGKSYWD